MTSLARLMAAPALALALAFCLPAFADSPLANLDTAVIEADLPKKKRTTPALYVTAAEAATILKENANVALIDVRTPSEIMFIGYATPTRAAIPAQFVDAGVRQAHEADDYKLVANPDFVAEVKAWLASEAGRDVEALLITCRSGNRSAPAVDKLAEAGVDLPLYSVVDGFEGDKNDAGVRNVNGWRNAGLPWTYKIRDGLRPQPD